MIGVIGAGAFGTALAVGEAVQGRPVTLWGRDAAAMDAIEAARANPRLPGIRLPETLTCTGDLGALNGASVLLLVVPAQQTAAFLASHADRLPPVPLVLCAKGIDADRLRLQTEIASAHVADRPLAALTGPGFAGEIAAGLPTALTLACASADTGRRLQEGLSTRRLRLYLTDDVTGAELGGALKNVIAIACGMAEGAKLGHSARAALMTRGFAEMRRIAEAKGGKAETLAGLSGLGDLALTAASPKSRNFAFGHALGRGEQPAPGVTQEGAATAGAAAALAGKLGVEAPIIASVARLAAGVTGVEEEMAALLSRPLRREE